MNYISSIRICNIKGWADHLFCFKERTIVPNKAHILVAPNGFGISSVAIAFKSLNTKRIDLDEKNYHRRDPNNKPEIQICYVSGDQEKLLSATLSNNSISSFFDIAVLNSPLLAKATKQNHGKYTTAISSMKIEPVILENIIPPKKVFSYRVSTIRNKFSKHFSRFLHNIDNLLCNHQITIRINDLLPWHELFLKKTQAVFDDIKRSAEVKNITKEIFCTIIQQKIQQLPIIQTALNDIIKTVDGCSYVEAFSILIQFICLYENKKEYRQVIAWDEYLQHKQHYEQTINDFNSSWNSICPKEENGKLVVRFPDADYLSNGQRDLLFLVLNLIKTEQTLKKDKCILIIDELFDYLDDANLVAFQYYVSKMIQRFRKQKRELYPFLLTHLDPKFFSHFRLAKMNVCYLDESSFSDDMHMSSLIECRTDDRIKEFVDKHLFHYSSNTPDVDYSDAFMDLKIKKVYADKTKFHELVLQQVNQYLLGQNSNPFAVCIAMRVRIEKMIYDQLPLELRNDFLNTKTTEAKLIFASEHNIEIPEIYFLLGIIYNPPLHADKERTDVMWNRLQRNLKNPAIRNMIATLFPDCAANQSL